MINRWVIGIVVSFIMKQIEKFGASVDWVKVKADLEPRVRQVVPGTWLDADAVEAVNAVVDAAARALAATDALQKIIDLMANQQWDAAFVALKDLLLKVWAAKVGTKEAALAAELALMSEVA